MADTIYMNRELSWLKFKERVLEEAENPENPLCERLTFASIYQSNLDEFYMVRVGSLVDQMLLAKDIRENKTNAKEKTVKKLRGPRESNQNCRLLNLFTRWDGNN